MKRVAVTTLGCKTNQFESAAIAESVADKGYEIVPFTDHADIYIINTCTVTARSDAESRRLIRRARKQNSSSRIVVTGCYAQLAYDDLRHLPGVSLILGNNEKKGIAGLLEEVAEEPKVMVSDVTEEAEVGGVVLESFAEHTRAFLQVQNGCDAFCSYCIVPYVRGSSRSVRLEEAVQGVSTFVEKGFQEVVLTGIHLGMYGVDLAPATSLLDLLNEIQTRTTVKRLRLGSLEPAEITDELIELVSASENICLHLHIPLQSGDDQVLSRMNRHYTTEFYRGVIEKIVKAMPGVCIGTDIIAGFPGESEGEFRNTLSLLRSLPLAYFHVFPFSSRDRTPAAKMPDKVSGTIVNQRAKALRELSDIKKRSYYKRFLGEKLQVLVQSREADGSCKGLSRNYIPVHIGGDCSVNSEVTATVVDVGEDFVRGDVRS